MNAARTIFVFITALTIFASNAFAGGMVVGKVTDAYTGEGLPGAQLHVEGTQIMSRAGSGGAFTLTDVPAGQQRITCGAISYNKQTKTVTVPEGGTVAVNFVLEIGAVIESEEVVVHDKKELIDETPQTSAHKFDIEELQDNAGAFEDVAKTMKKLPGVVQSSAFTADMYVRGAQNWENLILIDKMLLMNPYHFGVGLSIINTDLVKDVTFYAGGFPAKYPFATGSVLDVTYKDGNRERVDGMLAISMLSASGHVTGPIGDNVTFILSARRSYYDVMIDLLDYNDVPVPIFSDYLIRTTFDLGEYNRILVFALRSEDSIRLKIDEENPTSVDEGSAAYTGLTQVYGMNWELFPVKWFHMTNSLSHQILNLDANLTADAPLFANSQVNATYLHNQMEFQVHPRNLLTLGGDIGRVSVDLDARIRISSFVLGSNFQSDLDYFDTDFQHDKPVELYGGYFQNETELVKNKLRSNIGARFDYFKSDGEGWMISPRAAMAWTVVPKTVLKGSWGIYYFPPFNILATDKEWGNPDLRPSKATHYVLGLEQGVTEHGMLRVETFYIDFDDLQFQNFQQPTDTLDALVSTVSGDPPIGRVDWRNSGFGKSYGVELFAQKKLSGKWDGWLAYTLMEVLYNDGMGMYGWFHPFQDQRHTLNLVGNYRPFENWTFSGTFTLSSGKPYTPITGWKREYEGTFFQYWTPIQGEINSARLPVYHQLDVRIERKWDIGPRVDLAAFLEIYNIYNQDNVFDYWYAENEGIKEPEKRTIYQLPILPFVGTKIWF